MDRRHFLQSASAFTGTLASSVALSVEPPPLLKRKIPSSGTMIPVIGLGTSGPFEVGADAEARARLRGVLAMHFSAGASVIDTSPMYTTAEGVLGDLLTESQQKQCFMATKVWTPNSAGDPERAGITQMTASLAKLRRRSVDLMQVHNLVDLDVHLRTLRQWRDEGRIQYIGITHYTVSAHARLIEVIQREKIDFVQFNYSAVTRQAEERLLPLCADRGVAVLVNRAFEDGDLFTKVRGQPVPAWAAEFGATSWAQIFLKFVIAHPAVTAVIPATGKLTNLVDNLAGGRGTLPDAAQKARIVAALA